MKLRCDSRTLGWYSEIAARMGYTPFQNIAVAPPGVPAMRFAFVGGLDVCALCMVGTQHVCRGELC